MLGKIITIGVSLLVFLLVCWVLFWMYSYKTYNVEYGISFNQNHADSLGLDWKQVYTDMLQELQPKYVRVAAMWSEIEEEKGTHSFSDIDWMMNMAAKYNTKIVLVVGQKAPRWPECHVPTWIGGYSTEEVKGYLLDYVRETILRYKKHPALELWQVENEAFIRFEFGNCEGFNLDAVYEEVDLVRELDPDRKIVMTDSGELATWRRPSKTGDIFGTTLYRIVRTPSGRIFSYDFLPAGFYRLKARFWNKTESEFFVSELQAEPWFTDSDPLNASVEEMEETMNPERFQKHLNYASHVGASRVYLWGVEWWHYMKSKRGDSRYWDIVSTLSDRIE
jgi:hypothetical protein